MADTREELELKLLRAQVRQIERQSSWFASVGNMVTGIIISVVASLIIATVVYAFGEGWIASLLQRRDAITAETARLGSERDSLVRERDSVARAIAALSGTATLYDQGIDVTVEFPPSDPEVTSLVRASSSFPGVVIKAFDPCPGKYAFPGDAPVFGSSSCREVPEDRRHCVTRESKTECTFGPFFVMSDEVGIWLVAASDGRRAVRYVSLSPALEARER